MVRARAAGGPAAGASLGTWPDARAAMVHPCPMSTAIPTPLRAAAGLAAATIDEARRLPGQLVALPVLAVSSALQVSLKAQQHYADLVIRGDALLSQLQPEPADPPPWARFDEDEVAVADFSGADSFPVTEDLPVAEDFPATGATEPAPSVPGDAEVPPGGPEPAFLPGYDDLRLAQLRARLRRLSAEQVGQLLDYERRYQGRPAYLTMLGNRLDTIRSS